MINPWLKQIGLVLALVLAGSLAAIFIFQKKSPAADPHGHGEEHAGDPAKPRKGPHGGRLLGDEGFQIEMTLAEAGIPPVFHAFAYHEGHAIDPDEVKMQAVLSRVGGRLDTLAFAMEGGYLLGNKVVYEPHSFDAKVTASWNGKTYAWEYSQEEGRIELPAEAAERAGVVLAAVGPAEISETLKLNGKIKANEEQMAHILPRFPGVVGELRKRLGDKVKKGDVLALVESNENLQTYEVISPLAGTIIAKHATPGEAVTGEEALFIIADLNTVWIDFDVYRRDFARLRTGLPVSIETADGSDTARGSISYISPFGSENTQTMLARAVLPNPGGDWRPGLFVKGTVVLQKKKVPMAIQATALQTFRDWDVVFLNDGDVFEVQPLTLGRKDGQWVEVLEGLWPGARYAAGNSFILKAELGKAGASHDH